MYKIIVFSKLKWQKINLHITPGKQCGQLTGEHIGVESGLSGYAAAACIVCDILGLGFAFFFFFFNSFVSHITN